MPAQESEIETLRRENEQLRAQLRLAAKETYVESGLRDEINAFLNGEREEP